MATVAPADAALVADGKAAETEGLTALKTAVDGVLGYAEGDVKQVTGDAATFAQGFITAHASPFVAPFLNIAIGAAEGELPTLDTAMLAAISSFQKSVDAHIAAL